MVSPRFRQTMAQPAMPIQKTTDTKVSSYIAPFDSHDCQLALKGQGKYDCGFNALCLKNILQSTPGVPLRSTSLDRFVAHCLLGFTPSKVLVLEQKKWVAIPDDTDLDDVLVIE